MSDDKPFGFTVACSGKPSCSAASPLCVYAFIGLMGKCDVWWQAGVRLRIYWDWWDLCDRLRRSFAYRHNHLCRGITCDILPHRNLWFGVGFSATPGIPSDINWALFRLHEMPLRTVEQVQKCSNTL